jgi:fumarylacetoacetase
LGLINNGEQRGFLHDGDAVILKGWCEAPGAVRIGFGECRGEVLGVSVMSGDKPAIGSV